MSDTNIVILIGRLTRDAEMKYLSNGTAVCKFSLAVGKKYKKEDHQVEETSFVDCTLFGKKAEALNQYLVKGKQIAVEGELKQDRWEQDGQNRSKIGVTVNNVQLLGGGTQSDSKPQHSARNDSEPTAFPEEKVENGVFQYDDDIPF